MPLRGMGRAYASMSGEESSLVSGAEASFHDEFSSLQEQGEISGTTKMVDRTPSRQRKVAFIRLLKSPLCLLCTALVFLIVCIVISVGSSGSTRSGASIDDSDNPDTADPAVIPTPSPSVETPVPTLPPEQPTFVTSGSWVRSLVFLVATFLPWLA